MNISAGKTNSRQVDFTAAWTQNIKHISFFSCETSCSALTAPQEPRVIWTTAPLTGRTHVFVGPVRREHGLLAVVEARVVRVVTVQPLHELLPVSTKHAASPEEKKLVWAGPAAGRWIRSIGSDPVNLQTEIISRTRLVFSLQPVHSDKLNLFFKFLFHSWNLVCVWIKKNKVL